MLNIGIFFRKSTFYSKLNLFYSRCDAKPNDCVLCGKSLIPVEVNEETTSLCVCPPATNCRDCEKDVKRRLGGDNEHGFQYACSIHGKVKAFKTSTVDTRSKSNLLNQAVF